MIKKFGRLIDISGIWGSKLKLGSSWDRPIGMCASVMCVLLVGLSLVMIEYETALMDFFHLMSFAYICLLGVFLFLFIRAANSIWASYLSFPKGGFLRYLLVFALSAVIFPVFVFSTFAFINFDSEIERISSNNFKSIIKDSVAMSGIYKLEQKDLLIGLLESARRDFGSSVRPNSLMGFKSWMKGNEYVNKFDYAAILNSEGKVITSLGGFMPDTVFSPSANSRIGYSDLVYSKDDTTLSGSIKIDEQFFLIGGIRLNSAFVALEKDREARIRNYNNRLAISNSAHTKTIFVLLVFLITAMFLWIGFSFVDWIAARMRILLISAEKISEGDFSYKVPYLGSNELSLLGRGMNYLMDKLMERNMRIKDVQEGASARNSFIDAMFESINTGIICLNEQEKIHMINSKALEFIQAGGEGEEEYDAQNDIEALQEHHPFATKAYLLGKKLDKIFPELIPFLEQRDILSQKVEIVRNHKRLFLVVRCNRGNLSFLKKGILITIEDITVQIDANRKQIWSHIAKSLAHEIKNPLTPIQLSAERLKHKYLPNAKDDGDDFSFTVDTIINQVDTIKAMVDSFSSFARMPDPHFEEVYAKTLIEESVLLHKQEYKNISYKIEIQEGLEKVICDSAAFSRVLGNLIRNSSQALEEIPNKAKSFKGRILVSLTTMPDGKNCLTVKDNGKGFPDQLLDELIEPYVTTRQSGTGLGLSIVQKIAEAHNGVLILSNNQDKKYSGASASFAWRIESEQL